MTRPRSARRSRRARELERIRREAERDAQAQAEAEAGRGPGANGPMREAMQARVAGRVIAGRPGPAARRLRDAVRRRRKPLSADGVALLDDDPVEALLGRRELRVHALERLATICETARLRYHLRFAGMTYHGAYVGRARVSASS